LPWQLPWHHLNLDTGSTFKFVHPKNLTTYAKNSSISCTELKSVQFRHIFP